MDREQPICLYHRCPLTRHGVTLELISGPPSVLLRVTPAEPGKRFDGAGTTNPTGLIECMQMRGAKRG